MKVLSLFTLLLKSQTFIFAKYRLDIKYRLDNKLMERCVHTYKYNYLICNNLIFDKHAGFLTGHSTVYQLIDLYHQMVQSFDTTTHMCVIFCDISKAFDRVRHKGLLFKLKQLGITGRLHHGISEYIKNRHQRVTIGQSCSSYRPVSAGVLQ